jgi:hypothetical protein
MNEDAEKYTLETTRFDLKKNRIDKNEVEIIKNFIKKRDAYNEAEAKMRQYFDDKFKDAIENAKTKDDLKSVKEGLRFMPESVSKILIFRKIVIKEDWFSKVVV